MILSICIPTYNRTERLDDCLNSILISKNKVNNLKFEVCISDNNSNENAYKIVQKYENQLNIKFNKNEKNLGFAINAIKTISMAEGEYSWLIGNDDLLLPETLLYLQELLQENLDKDYFFINSYHLQSDYLTQFSKPFDTKNLKHNQMKTISKLKKNKSAPFWDAIDPKVSWDFLIGIYLSIFRTKKWIGAIDIIDKEKIADTGVWSNFENTCLHPIIIANAFKNSEAFICAKPLSVNLIGEREWGSLYEFIEIIRIPELLDYYRSQGLKLKSYLFCKNFALRNFSSYIFKIFIGGDKKGRKYLKFKRHIFNNIIFPNVYISFFSVIFKKIVNLINLKKK